MNAASSFHVGVAPPAQRRLKVMCVTPSLGLGGAETIAGNLMASLDQSLFEPSVVSMGPKSNSPVEGLLEWRGIPVWYLDKAQGLSPTTFKKLRRIRQAVQPDVIHTHMSGVVYAVPAIAGGAACGIVHTVHSLDEDRPDKLGRFIDRTAMRLGVIPVAVSEAVAAAMRRVHGMAHCVVIPNGIPVSKFERTQDQKMEWRERNGFSRQETLLACVARLEKVKNHALLISAFAAITAQHPGVKLLITGEGERFAALQRQIEDLQLPNQVRLLGLRADIPELLGACDAFALTSDREGNPLAVMEAMAAGLPIVATAVGGIPELVRDGVDGIVVNAGDVVSLSVALGELLHNPEKMLAMGRRGRERAKEHFDLAAVASRYGRLYEAVVLRPNAASGVCEPKVHAAVTREQA